MKWPTLAPELIYEVLDQCRADSKVLSVTKPSSFPWYLGHICSAWREVFISSPRFWNALDICITDVSPARLRRFAVFKQVARIGLVRSKDCPISFRLFILNRLPFPEDISLRRQIIESLVENSARWRDAYISVSASDMAIIYPAKNRMPLLHSFQLSLLSDKISDHEFLPASVAAKRYSDFLMDAPQLTRIRFQHDTPLWKINWSLITVIHFRDIPPPLQLYAHLSQMSCLVELVIRDNFRGDELSNIGMAPVTFPHLKSLHSPANFLQIVDTPALQELHIRCDISMIENESALKAIIFRYFQSLSHLSKLRITAYGWEDAALIIQHMPRVDHLILSSEPAAELLEILDDYPQMGTLETVTFILLGPSQVEEDRLLETITSWRRKPGKTRGIGPFHALTEMTFELLSIYHWRSIDLLKIHLEEQEMHYTISEDPLPSFPQFDAL